MFFQQRAVSIGLGGVWRALALSQAAPASLILEVTAAGSVCDAAEFAKEELRPL